MSTSTRIRALKSKVLWSLKEIPETRNSDIALTLAIWKKFYSEFLKYDKYDRLWVQVKNLYDLPREDNIKRLRAKIQNPKPFLRTGRLSDLPYYLQRMKS